MGIIDGQLKRAQLEEIAASSALPAARSRIYADITVPTVAVPKFFDGSIWVSLKGSRLIVQALSSVGNVSENTDVLLANANSGVFDATLPDPAAFPGFTILARKVDGTFNRVTLKRGGTTYWTLNTYQEWVRVYSDGAIWTAIEWGTYGGALSFTPQGSWITNTTYTGKYTRLGNVLFMDVLLSLTGAPTAATLTLALPSGLTLDTTQMAGGTATGSGADMVGSGYSFDTSANSYFDLFCTPSSTTAIFCLSDSGNSVYNATSPFTFATGDKISVRIRIPILEWSQ